jgi:hypothetical protein
MNKLVTMLGFAALGLITVSILVFLFATGIAWTLEALVPGFMNINFCLRLAVFFGGCFFVASIAHSLSKMKA